VWRKEREVRSLPAKSNETLWLGAKVVADFLLRVHGVKAVGLFGSLARNQLAADADLIVFSDTLYKRLGYLKYALHLEKYKDIVRLGLTVIETRDLMALAKYYYAFTIQTEDFLFTVKPITFDVVVFPEEYSVQFKKDVDVAERHHPEFLPNVARDILFWNPATQQFQKDNELWKRGFESNLIPVPKVKIPTSEVKSPEVRIQVIGSMDSGQGSSLLIRDGGLTVALDCGASPFNGNGLSVGQTTERIVREMVNAKPQFLVVSHYHHDHWGAIPQLFEQLRRNRSPLPTIVSTDLTFALLQRHINPGFLYGWFHRISHQRETDQIKLIPNKHSVPGSAAVLFHGKKTVFYTGDLYELDYKDPLPETDLLIVDSTGSMREESRQDKEALIRQNIVVLISETLKKDRFANAYIALFSTQLERAAYLQQEAKVITGSSPMINGTSLFQNLSVFNRTVSVYFSSRVVLCTGIWAQGENNWFGEGASALVRISNGTDRYCQLKKGDLVILSGSIPTWSLSLSSQIEAMCLRLSQIGARVIVDTSAPEEWSRFAERKEVHSGGHGNFPEIVSVIKNLKPKQVLPFHASQEARQKVADYCKSKGISVISATQSSIITL